MKYISYYSAGWRRYQARLQRFARLKHLLKKLPLLLVISGGIFLIVGFIFFSVSWLAGQLKQTDQRSFYPNSESDVKPERLSLQDLSDFFDDGATGSFRLADQFVLEKDGSRFTIRTTIDVKLQKYIDHLLRRSKSLQAAVVVLNADDGRVLALSSHDAVGTQENLCLQADFPAASLFKIVSAAAALEAAGFTPDKVVFYKGSKHTLYKYQLKESDGPHGISTKFRKAFASSNNSVFGKVGIYTLGQKVIADYAEKFFFNRPIPFDLQVGVSTIEVPADDFGLAEIASGFNKRTLISPLHAAMLASVVADNGKMAAPWLVDSISDEAGKDIYQAGRSVLNAPINRKTAEDLKVLMQDAVVYGTGRTAFRKLHRKKEFKNFSLGAKTGTINDRTDTYKYDWLAAYALTPDRTKGICISVVSVHGEKLGVRSSELARAIINYHFTSK